MARRLVAAAAVVAAFAVAVPASAQDEPLPPETGGVVPLGPDKKRLRFAQGPYHVQPGQNVISAGPLTIDRALYDVYVTRFRANLVRADGRVPPVDAIHLHHGVWLNLARGDITAPALPGQRIAATGEEKTIVSFPEPYGYLQRGSDPLVFNHMIHNQTTAVEEVWTIVEVDVVAADSPTGRQMVAGDPVWMDVRNGEAYAVFDVHRGSGGDGEFTYPDEARSPYGSRPPMNEWVVDRDGTLVFAAGHLHPGGLNNELWVERDGRRQLLFRSEANYFNDRPPVSWDMAMTTTRPEWRVGLRRGDKLSLHATYNSEIASWYEAMGIQMAMFVPGVAGPDPFESPPPASGQITHGPLPENSNFGGEPTGLPDPAAVPDGTALDNNVGIAAFLYTPGTLGAFGPLGNPPAIPKGQEIQFHNADAGPQVFHTITACRAPCNRSTGIGYPLADADVQFDSGQLGYGPRGFTAAVNRASWALDTEDLDPGTYTYFCRVHPFMRGAFRVR